MKTRIFSHVFGMMFVLSVFAALGQDEETDPLAGNQAVTPVFSRTDTLLSAATRERLARTIFQEKAPDRFVTKRVVLSGPLIALFQSDNLGETFNPFSLANSGEQTLRVPADVYLPRPRGWVLFRLEF